MLGLTETEPSLLQPHEAYLLEYFFHLSRIPAISKVKYGTQNVKIWTQNFIVSCTWMISASSKYLSYFSMTISRANASSKFDLACQVIYHLWHFIYDWYSNSTNCDLKISNITTSRLTYLWTSVPEVNGLYFSMTRVMRLGSTCTENG